MPKKYTALATVTTTITIEFDDDEVVCLEDQAHSAVSDYLGLTITNENDTDIEILNVEEKAEPA